MKLRLGLFILLLVAVLPLQGQDKKPAPKKPKKPAAAQEKKEEWKRFTSREGAFTVLMPGTPVMKKEMPQTPVGVVPTYLFSLEVVQGTNMTVSFADVPEGLLGLVEGVDDLLLNNARDAAVKQIDGKLLEDKRVTLNQRFAGREFQIDVGLGSILRMRVFLVRNRVFQIVVAGPKEYATGKDGDKFLDSFTLTR